VTFVGVIKHEQAPAYLNTCVILVSPHEDMADGSPFFGSPTKLFEYMAMGKGIIASRVGQLREILQHKTDAILVEPKDPKDLARGIVCLINDLELRDSLGKAAQEKVLARYTWEQNFLRSVSLENSTAF